MTDVGPIRTQGRWRLVRGLAGVVAVVLGLGLVLLVAAVGHCSAFGGSCPAEAPPLFEDDVFGSAAMGGFIAVGIPCGWLNLRFSGSGSPCQWGSVLPSSSG